MIDAKLAGMDVTREEIDAEPEGTRVIDLMARLEESLKRPRAGTKAKRAEAHAESHSSRSKPVRTKQRGEARKTRTTRRRSA